VKFSTQVLISLWKRVGRCALSIRFSVSWSALHHFGAAMARMH